MRLGHEDFVCVEIRLVTQSDVVVNTVLAGRLPKGEQVGFGGERTSSLGRGEEVGIDVPKLTLDVSL